MKGTYLKFFVDEGMRLHGILGYEWLLEQARAAGLPGGLAFRAIAGYGRHGVMHEDHFFELAGQLPVEVGFVVTDAEADRLLALLAAEKVSLFYVRHPVDSGFTAERKG
jgi:PII-like signaling protein